MLKQQKEIISVLGMHRSGTSALTRCINLLGVNIGDNESLYAPREDNPKGFWENSEIAKLNDQILTYFFCQWDKLLPLPVKWIEHKNIKQYYEEINIILNRQLENGNSWLIKDPRISLTLPLWTKSFQELKIKESYIISLRNPIDVYYSLKKRDGFSKEKVFYLWTIYNLSILYWTYGKRRLIVSYDNLIEDTTISINKISDFLNIDYQKNSYQSKIDSFLSGSLRHSKTMLDDLNLHDELGEITKELYILLLEAEKDITILETPKAISFINYHYNQFQNSFIYIWGASHGGQIVEKKMMEKGISITGFLDNDSLKWGKNFLGKPVFKPEEILNSKNKFEKPFIIIGSSFSNEIISELSKNQYDDFKVFSSLL